jgi:hypothetical protein
MCLPRQEPSRPPSNTPFQARQPISQTFNQSAVQAAVQSAVSQHSLFSHLSSPALSCTFRFQRTSRYPTILLASQAAPSYRGPVQPPNAPLPRPRSAAKMLLPKLSVATLRRHPDSSIAAEACSPTSSYCATRPRRPLLNEDGTPLVGESQIQGHTARASRSPGIHSNSFVRIVTITFVDTVSVSIPTNHSTHI